MSARRPDILDRLDDFAFRDFLTRDLGWSPLPDPPLRVSAEGTTVELSPLAASNGRIALHHETPIDGSLPTYDVRRAIRVAAAGEFPDPLIVFSDVLHTAQVWQWVERRNGRPGLFREYAQRPGGDAGALLRRLGRLDRAAPRPNSDHDLLSHTTDCLIPALLRLVRQRHPAAFRTGGPIERRLAESADLSRAVQLVIEEAEDPELLRALWRALAELAVIDPACGTGVRLQAALDVLEPIYEASLERMGSWVADLDRNRAPRRPEKLADFRATLERADDARRYADRRQYVVAAILRNNLYGTDPQARAVEECRQRLSADLDFAVPAAMRPTDLVPNLRTGNPDHGISTDAELRLALPEAPDAASRLRRIAEEAEAIDRTLRLRRRMWDDEDGDPRAPSGTPGLRDRLEALRAQLDALVAHQHGIPQGRWRQWRETHRPLHVWLEFHGVIARGGFDVVLGEVERVKEVPLPFDRSPDFAPVRTDTAPPLPMNPDACTRIRQRGPAYPADLTRLLGEHAPDVLTARGNVELLNTPALAVFCSVRAPGDVILHSLDLARELREAGVATIGGFHSPVERECLTFLLRGDQPVIVSHARAIERMRLPSAWRAPLEEGRLLLVSHFDERSRRPTSRMTEARNLVVGALAASAFVAHAAPGGRTYRLAKQLLDWGKPVFTLDDPHNQDLLLLGARPVPQRPGKMLAGG